MGAALSTIGFDANDTLWQNETFFRLTQERFVDLLRDYAARDHLEERLLAAEMKNLGTYGFGIKGFMLSMIETAIEVTDKRVPATVISELLEAGQDMLRHPIHLLNHAEAAVRHLSASYRLILITKGDLLDQERKLAQSGLGDFFDAVEIVSRKTRATYKDAFHRHGDGPDRAMMVGNSMKSDILPALAAGAWAVFVPHGLTWSAEQADPPNAQPRYAELPDLGGLPDLVADLDG